MTAPLVEFTSTNHVVLLDQHSFPSFIEANKMVLITFFHKLIPSCARFMPIFERTAQAMHDSGIKFAQMDCMENAEICQNFPLSAYPAVMLFQGIDNAKAYHNARREQDIISYLTRQMYPTISTITAETLQDFKTKNDVVVVGYFSPDDRKSHEAFTQLAEDLRDDFLFGITCDDTLAKTEHIEIPSIVVYKRSEGKDVLKSTHDSYSMSAHVKRASRPLVVEFRPELHNGYFDLGIPLGYILTNNSDDQARLSKMVRPLAKKYKDRILFGTIDKEGIERFSSLADHLWFKVNNLTSFTIREPIQNLRFPFDDQKEMSEQELDTFIEAFIRGELKPTIKSEPLPDVQKSPVHDVVGLTYNEIVMDQEKDVLLEFCTVWCGPCKTFRSTYEKLAELYISDKTLKNQVTIATIDADANDFPDRDIRGFPFFKLYPAHAKDSTILYFGPRTLEGMTVFIRDNGTHKAMPKFGLTNDESKG